VFASDIINVLCYFVAREKNTCRMTLFKNMTLRETFGPDKRRGYRKAENNI